MFERLNNKNAGVNFQIHFSRLTMITFLGQAARHIFDNHKLNELQHLQIILPSRRAALYFKNELSSLSGVPFFSPVIKSIDDFIQEASGFKVIDPVELYFEIFEIWKQSDANQSFEKFLTWVPTLVKDFNLIDSSLLQDPHLLFKYMSEAEAISRWKLDSEVHVFSDSSLNYFTFFDKMAAVYEQLKVRLMEKGLSYTGLTYRYVSENTELLESEDINHFYFVGLNALSVAEEKIVKGLVKKKMATCIWDSDEFYMDKKAKDKAGRKLRKYKEGGEFGKEWSFLGNQLLSSEKTLNVFELSSNVQQSKLCLDLLVKSRSHSHAVVVLDESDFTSLFVQLPALEQKFNVSAGISYKASALASAIEVISKMLDFTESGIRSSVVRDILSNEVVAKVAFDEADAMSLLPPNIHLFLAKKDLLQRFHEFPLLQEILSIKDVDSFLVTVKGFLQDFVKLETDEVPFGYELQEKLNILRLKWEENPQLSVDAFRILLKELTKNISVPFEKEPGAKLQIMSMLETRCLDFEEVTFISFLEGNLPSAQKNNSFIPFDAASTFKLPLYSDQDAIMAYHFLRLLQRAKRVNFLYTKDLGTGVGRKERSRFLYQIEEELAVKNPKIRIDYPKVQLSSIAKKEDETILEIQKTADIQTKIKFFLEERGFSPTSLNGYFSGELEFYWKYIERIKSKEKDSVDIGSDVFGEIVHYILEHTDKPYLDSGKEINKGELVAQKQQALDGFDTYLKACKPNFDFDYGLNSVMKTVAKELIGKYFDKRIREFKVPFTVVALEKQFVRFINVDGCNVKVQGKVDKIEKHGETYVIIDYKTGDVETSAITYKDKNGTLLEVLQMPNRDKFRQLLTYNFLIGDTFGATASLNFKFYSFKKLNESLELNVGDLSRFEVLNGVEEMVSEVTRNLLDLEKPFGISETVNVQEYSDFYELLRGA